MQQKSIQKHNTDNSRIPIEQDTCGIQVFRGHKSDDVVGFELFFIATGNLNQPDKTRVMAGKFGVRVNTNQEFVYRLGHDFCDFVEHALLNDMILSFYTKKLPVNEGVRTMHADDQDVEVTVNHNPVWSRVTIKLDPKFKRVPRWIPEHPIWSSVPRNPGNYRGYETENPFCLRTLTEVLSNLVSNTDEYLPNYYVVTYKKPSKDTGFAQHESGVFAEVVVPLMFKPEPEGQQIKHRGFSNGVGVIELAVLHQNDSNTTARIGAYGMHVDGRHEHIVTHELANIRAPGWQVPERMKSSFYAQFNSIHGKGWQYPMWITMDTPKRLPVKEGEHKLRADGQDISLRVWHSGDSSHVAVSLPDTYQRSPHYWWDFWGGANNPGNYPGYENEVPFCGRTVQEVFQKLAPDNKSCLPEWYQVSYAEDGLTLENIKPDVDISFQNNTDIPTFVVPFYKYFKET